MRTSIPLSSVKLTRVNHKKFLATTYRKRHSADVWWCIGSNWKKKMWWLHFQIDSCCKTGCNDWIRSKICLNMNEWLNDFSPFQVCIMELSRLQSWWPFCSLQSWLDCCGLCIRETRWASGGFHHLAAPFTALRPQTRTETFSWRISRHTRGISVCRRFGWHGADI